MKKTYSYDELEINSTFFSPTRTITEFDVLQFAGVTGDFNELHTSKTFAEKTEFGERIAHGMLVLSMANGLYMRSGVFDTSVFLGIEQWKSTKPVYIGDTIMLKLTIVDKRLTRDGKRAIIGMQYDVLNQNEAVVATGLFRRMINVSASEQ